MFPLFATGVVDTGGKFAAGIFDPVSTTQGELVTKFAACVVDTGGNDTGVNDTGVNDTGGAP